MNSKTLFLSNVEDVKKFEDMMASPIMKKAIVMALAELCSSTLTQEELRGANRFVATFERMHVREIGESFPTRELKTM